MTALHPSSPARPMVDARMVRQMLATILAGLLVFVSVSFAGADTLAPRTNTGGAGAAVVNIADMLRGDYSPVPTTEEIVVTVVQAPVSVSDALRGEFSPVDSGPAIAITENQAPVSVAEMVRGDLSPIAQDVV